MSAQPDIEYLDISAVAKRTGLQRSTISEELSRGRMPEPDLVWLRHPLWLPDTIDAWRANRYKRGRLNIPKKYRVTPTVKPRTRPPKVKTKTTPRPKAKTQYVDKTDKPPAVSVITAKVASRIAGELRNDGHYATTEDVMTLASWSDEPLDHDREELRQRVAAKLRKRR